MLIEVRKLVREDSHFETDRSMGVLLVKLCFIFLPYVLVTGGIICTRYVRTSLDLACYTSYMLNYVACFTSSFPLVRVYQ